MSKDSDFRKQIEEARLAEWDVKDTEQDKLYEDLAYKDFIANLEENLSEYGMYIEYVDLSEEDLYDSEDEYENCIMSYPKDIRKYLKELIEDVKDIYFNEDY